MTVQIIWPVNASRARQKVLAKDNTKPTLKSIGTRVIRTGSNTTIIKSGCYCVEVIIEGVAVSGLIDTGSDITIIRGDLFYQIVSESGLKLQSLKPVEQKACTYDQKPITLDGQMDMKVSIGDKTIITTVYVKLVAPDQLLLSETVCRHLGIVSYHPNVQSVERCQPVEQNVSEINALCVATTGERESCEFTDDQVLPPVEDTLSDVKVHTNSQLMKACSQVNNYRIW